MRMAQELEEQLLNIQRQKYRGIRLQQKQLSAILYTPVLRMAPSFDLCVLYGNSVCKRLLVHVQAESSYLYVSVWLCWYTVGSWPRDPSILQEEAKVTGRLHQLHV